MSSRPWFIGVLVLCCGRVAAALPQSTVEIVFSAGRVTMSVTDARVADVLVAWGRVGHAEVSGTEYLGARRISLHLTNTEEADALKALVGSPGWFTTVARENAGDRESVFREIALLPEAVTSARTDPAAVPERRYAYYMDPAVEAGAAAMLATAAAPPRGVPRPDVEPEKLYQYSPATTNVRDELHRMLPPPGAQAIQSPPAPGMIGVEPEKVYTYSPTPEPIEPVVQATFTPAQPTQPVPEARYEYSPPQMGLEVDLATVYGLLPSLPMFDGFVGLERLPGRVIRYVLER